MMTMGFLYDTSLIKFWKFLFTSGLRVSFGMSIGFYQYFYSYYRIVFVDIVGYSNKFANLL